MNEAYKNFLRQPELARRNAYESTSTQLGTNHQYVEKDLWVCVVLDALYHDLPGDQPRLLFKGGTSLSKAFNLIERFSEDVDLVVFRHDLGFVRDRDPTGQPDALSNSRRKKLFEELRQACSEYVHGPLREHLQSVLMQVDERCTVTIDPNDVDQQSILVNYPTLYAGLEGDSYVVPAVKLEGGARSALDPHLDCTIAPYIDRHLPDFDLTVSGIRTIQSSRTFYDKVMVLHGTYCGYRDEGRLPREGGRLSRHYYDAARLFDSDDAEAMLRDRTLWASVREHNALAYRQAWKKIEEAVPGTTCIVPDGDLLGALEHDYQNMRDMLFGDPPTWEWVMERLRGLEEVINRT